MMTRGRRLRAAALAGALALAACGSQESDTAKTLRQLPQLLLSRGEAEPPRVTQAQIAQVLASTAVPVRFVDLERTGASTLITEIQRNGPYRTYATSARQSITFLGGVVTGTRGLGGDLMSSEADALLAAIGSGKPVTVPYTLRFLTPEDVTVELKASCNVAPGGRVPSSLEPVAGLGQIVTAHCLFDDTTFVDSFIVAPGGFVLGTRQWLGEFQGYLTSYALRL